MQEILLSFQILFLQLSINYVDYDWLLFSANNFYTTNNNDNYQES